jgi:acyl dehydratase
MNEAQLFYEDFAAGQVYAGQSRTLDETAYKLFASVTGDAHPIHYDRDYASKTRFGERVAHGLLLMSITALGATPLSGRLESSMVALVEQDGRFLKPVLIGETVSTEFEVQEKRDLSAPAHGLVRFAVRVRNAAGEVVLAGHHSYLIKRRSA